MVATIKIIPLAVAGRFVEEAQRLLRSHAAFEVKPFVARRAALIATQLPTLKPQVMDKTKAILAARLRQSGSEILTERRVAHTEGAVAAAIDDLQADHDLLVVFGASAVADPHDVIPAAVRRAGGIVDHVGMPVDPGNLLVLGRVGEIPVIGVIKGQALGFGCAIAAVCDITLAADTAKFQVPEMAHNIMPTMVMSALVDRVPRKAMTYFVWSTAFFPASRAREAGIVSEIFPEAELEGALDALDRDIAPIDDIRSTKDYRMTVSRNLVRAFLS